MSGEGGLITTNDEKIAEKCKMFRHHGQSEKTKYEYFDLGYNYRMTDILAAIGLVQLKKIESFSRRRIQNAELLSRGLKDVKGLIIPKIKAEHRHVFHQYTVRIDKDFGHSRDELIESLKKRGINPGVYYPKPLHLHRHFKNQGYKAGDFPVSEQMSKEVLSLPVHPRLRSRDILYIIKTVKGIANEK